MGICHVILRIGNANSAILLLLSKVGYVYPIKSHNLDKEEIYVSLPHEMSCLYVNEVLY